MEDINYLTALIIIILALCTSVVFSQTPKRHFIEEEIDAEQMTGLKKLYGKKKVLPEGYEKQVLIALSHYPKLKDVKIKFRVRRKKIPFTSRPTVWSTFFKKPEKRTYLIIISSHTGGRLAPILLKNMDFNAQIGVLGHELAHTVDFLERNVWGMLNVVFGNLSKKYMDKFEYETDRRAIQNGLGYQLLAWSKHAVRTLRVNEPPRDKVSGIMQRERYMRPETIIREMKKLPMYGDVALEK